MKRYILISVVLILISCSKIKNKEKLYDGTVVGLAGGCFLYPGQFPYRIRFDDVSQLEEDHPIRVYSNFDTCCAALIPDEYKIIGKKIKFAFRKRNADEEFTCDASVSYYQAIITEISATQ
ncbi:MAG: hypothetical protein JWN78_1780 [Bacteroidota bacterium]|nr:hypothetical protein [Bacteroidota bacterium]